MYSKSINNWRRWEKESDVGSSMNFSPRVVYKVALTSGANVLYFKLNKILVTAFFILPSVFLLFFFLDCLHPVHYHTQHH